VIIGLAFKMLLLKWAFHLKKGNRPFVSTEIFHGKRAIVAIFMKKLPVYPFNIAEFPRFAS
jgi:hypothetical protein